MKRSLSPAATAGLYGGWLLLSALAALAAWQIHATFVVVATLWLASDLPRPAGWTPQTLVGLSKSSLLILGSLWLVGVTYMERRLNVEAQRGRFVREMFVFTLIGAGLLGASHVMLRLL